MYLSEFGPDIRLTGTSIHYSCPILKRGRLWKFYSEHITRDMKRSVETTIFSSHSLNQKQPSDASLCGIHAYPGMILAPGHCPTDFSLAYQAWPPSSTKSEHSSSTLWMRYIVLRYGI